MKLPHILAAAAVLLAGCATWTFEPTRSSKFVNEENAYLHVDYGLEEHESTFYGPSGVPMPFKSKLKVRVEMPDGTRFVAYQNLAPTGNLYKTEDEEWEFFESGGAGCLVAQLDKDRSGYITRFRGTLCATVRNPANVTRERIRSGGSTPHGFGRDANGPRDVTNEKK